MEPVEFKKRAGRNRQLTERDRELCGFLAVCRYLTRETDRKTDVSRKDQGKVFDQAETVGVEDARPGGGGTRRPGVRERGGMDRQSGL